MGNEHSKTALVRREDKVAFVNEKFMVGKTIEHLQFMMTEVTKGEVNARNVNAACNCIARLNETIDTAIKAARYLSESGNQE